MVSGLRLKPRPGTVERWHDDAVAAIESTVSVGSTLAISAVTWSELLHGAVLRHHPEEAIRELVEDFGVDIVDVDRGTANHAMTLQAVYNATSKKASSASSVSLTRSSSPPTSSTPTSTTSSAAMRSGRRSRASARTSSRS
jgi:hypothetical protein